MRYTIFLFLMALLTGSGIATAQDNSLSAKTGLGPGDTFTLFVAFKNPMNVQSIGCAFNLSGKTQQGQEGFSIQMRCNGASVKDDDVKVIIPTEIATGDYAINWINVTMDDIGHQYDGKDLPDLQIIKVTRIQNILSFLQ